MGAYEFQALDDRGRSTRGVMQGDTARQIRQLLRDKGLSPIEVTEVSDRSEAGSRRASMSTAELALLLRQLATMLRAALPLEEALSATAEQAEKPKLKRVLVSIRARVMEGHSLSKAMSEYPKAFPDVIRSSIAAGEQSGKLDTVLARLADYAESKDELRRAVMVATIYPAVLVTVAVLVVGGLLTWVVPQVVEVFDRMDSQLPLLTRGLIALSDWVRAWGVWFLLALIGAGGGLAWWLRDGPARERFDAGILRVPVVGRLARAANAARFTRTLALLTASAVPALESLKIGSQVVSNRAVRASAQRASERVREGTSIAGALGEGGYFPPVALRLIASGERSGRLDTMLDAAADTLERQVKSSLAIMMGILEPLFILLVGVMVLLIVLAILLPIFDLNQLVG